MNAKQTHTASPSHILLADDDRELRALLGQLLCKDGHQVTELADGWALHQRVSRTDEAPFDLVLSDVRMPGPSVFSTLERVRDSPPVVLMSGFADEVVHRRARDHEAPRADRRRRHGAASARRGRAPRARLRGRGSAQRLLAARPYR